jgi:hypothetical protein
MHRRKDNRRYYRISPICVGVDRVSYVLDVDFKSVIVFLW